jgi:hypothetical protein
VEAAQHLQEWCLPLSVRVFEVVLVMRRGSLGGKGCGGRCL